MRILIEDILTYLNEKKIRFSFIGDKTQEIEGFSSIYNYVSKTLTWLKNKQILDPNVCKNVRLCVVQKGIEVEIKNQIISEDSKLCFFSILQHFFGEKRVYAIADSAIIESEINLQNISIGHNSYIGKNVLIGENTIIENNVSIDNKVVIGKNCIIHSGSVIGSDGFGYYINSDGCGDKVIHFGGVVLGDNVEIGANCCIDRGTIEDTILEDNVKIDNLVHIAHNAKIGKGTMIVAGSIVCGSTNIGERCYIAPGGIVRNQIKVEDNAFVGMGAVVTKNVENSNVVVGNPAKAIRKVTPADK